VSIVPRLRSLLYRISNLSNLFRFIVLWPRIWLFWWNFITHMKGMFVFLL
jgi:hypothetical protein